MKKVSLLLLIPFLIITSCTTVKTETVSFEEDYAAKSGISEFTAKSLFSVCEKVGIVKESIGHLEYETAFPDRKAYTFIYSGEQITAYMLIKNGTICALSIDGEYLYTDGEAIRDIKSLILTTGQITDLKKYSKKLVESILKAPLTAKFGPLDYRRENNFHYVEGYVDAQNSFGAMLRTDFVCKYAIDQDSYQPYLVDFDYE